MNRYLVVALLLLCSVALSECGCYKNWSRCTPQTKFWTGILWKNCPDYCRQCKGRAGGKCTGGSVQKSKNPLVIATCKLGL
ncbi:hypothetical protein ANCCEY_10170 [Ancylostoma ceylanicum]|uniref:ShKT domain-containing protein n=1 Tax=Ancylostoma ceylanicum TaxID=53326 RepID=A0A0D6LL51_9BILA|nr:hypothetical protein ANCCEY_10170 [Ancylostoma ceylanicum]